MNVRRSTSGFSLIELLIAMAIGLAILAVLGTVFSRTSSGRSDLERVTRLVENSRFAAEVIGEDVRHAGFYGALMPPSDVVYEDPSPCVIPVDAVALGWRPNDSPPRYPAPLQGWTSPAGGGEDPDCLAWLAQRVANTDVLVIRRVSSEPTEAANVNSLPFTARNFFVQPSQCVSDPAVVRVSDTAASLDLRTAACTAALAPARRYFTRAYYVARCNDCTGAGDGIPTLKRIEYLNGAYQETALAEGVENLQFEYAIDALPAAPASPDGVPESMVTSTANWANVVGVRMHLLMRSSEPGLTADATPTLFDLGPGHANVPCPDRFRCRLLTTTFRLNNVAGRREK
jgi:type IV pilus assembly protein PilW